jgi:CPA2 family monovalent cation:H+ antiporter-2
MLIDPEFLWREATTVLLVVALVFLVKGALFAGITRGFGYGNIAPFAVGFGLFQVGEFSFVLARVGIDAGAISGRLYSIVLTTAVVTMALTPFAGAARPRRLRPVARAVPQGDHADLQPAGDGPQGARDRGRIRAGGKLRGRDASPPGASGRGGRRQPRPGEGQRRAGVARRLR